jgi:hypothetical protein
MTEIEYISANLLRLIATEKSRVVVDNRLDGQSTKPFV